MGWEARVSGSGPTTCGCGLNKDQVFHIINITVCAFSCLAIFQYPCNVIRLFYPSMFKTENQVFNTYNKHVIQTSFSCVFRSIAKFLGEV